MTSIGEAVARLTMALAMVVLAIDAASAQSSAAYVRSRLAVGQVVWVTSASEGTLQGRVAAISDSQFEVSMLGRVAKYPWAEIRMIEVKDSLKNGAILGGIIGGLALAQIPSPRTPTNLTAYALLGAGLGAATGAYFDFLREGREEILRSHSGTASLAPMFLPKTVGLSAVLQW